MLMSHYKCRRIREELSNQNAETNNLTNKLDRVSNYGSVWVSSSKSGEENKKKKIK